LPASGTFYIEVTTYDAVNGLPPEDGTYELFIYRFDAGNTTDGGDSLDGRGGDDTVVGGLGDDSITGGTGRDQLDGGAGVDSLVETRDANFTLTDKYLTVGAEGSDAISAFENAILSGDAGNNSFVLTAWNGTADLHGGGGTDNVTLAQDTNMSLSDNLLSRDAGGAISLSGIEDAALTGGGAGNTFTLTGWNGTAALHGLEGADTVILTQDTNFGLRDNSLTRDQGGAITLVSIEHAGLTGGSSNNTFDVTGWNGTARLAGEAGTDRVVLTQDVNFVLSDQSLTRTSGGAIELTSVEDAFLTGMASGNTFDVTMWTGTATVDGGGGTDLVVSANDASFVLTDTSLSRSTGGTFTLASLEKAQLTGGASANILNAAGFSGSVTLSGLGGNDSITGGSSNDVLLGGTENDTIRGGNGRDLMIGGWGRDSLFGDGEEDILIGGYTAYDNNLTALDFIMREWSRTDLRHQQRRANLFNGNGLNNGYILFDRGSRATVFDDNDVDELTGGLGALDLFFAARNDNVKDREGGEIFP
jgi:Ca2+-binding RTX toxin-like protein